MKRLFPMGGIQLCSGQLASTRGDICSREGDEDREIARSVNLETTKHEEMGTMIKTEDCAMINTFGKRA